MFDIGNNTAFEIDEEHQSENEIENITSTSGYIDLCAVQSVLGVRDGGASGRTSN